MSRLPAAACQVDETEHLRIEMPDGVRLAARLWLPREAALRPVPALLEYIPYRKGDMVRARDERYHPYFAAHGYAACGWTCVARATARATWPTCTRPRSCPTPGT